MYFLSLGVEGLYQDPSDSALMCGMADDVGFQTQAVKTDETW